LRLNAKSLEVGDLDAELVRSKQTIDLAAAASGRVTTFHYNREVVEILNGTEQLDRGEGIPEDQLDPHLTRLKSKTK
jgi:hypothetical protein